MAPKNTAGTISSATSTATLWLATSTARALSAQTACSSSVWRRGMCIAASRCCGVGSCPAAYQRSDGRKINAVPTATATIPVITTVATIPGDWPSNMWCAAPVISRPSAVTTTVTSATAMMCARVTPAT